MAESHGGPDLLRPAFVVGGLYSKANGVAWIMQGLAAALSGQGAPVTVYAADCLGRRSIPEIFAPETRWVSEPGLWLGGLSYSPLLRQKLERAIEDVDVVHNHSLWMLPTTYACRAARAAGTAVLFSAHGALEPWALANSAWKKRLAQAWFQRRDLEEADCIHVNSRREAASIRDYGLNGPVAVIPNGVDMEVFRDLPDPQRFRDQYPAIGEKKIALFLGRLHAKKGLRHLIEAWAVVREEHADWHLVIAGPDKGFGATARALVAELGLASEVTFTGGVQSARKLLAFTAADAFVLPSFSEGLPMAVLEAMAAGCPVLISVECNFSRAVEAGGGIEVKPTVESTADGLRRLMSAPAEERRSMGRRARRLVESDYTWDTVASRMLELYRWLCGNGRKPLFVED